MAYKINKLKWQRIADLYKRGKQGFYKQNERDARDTQPLFVLFVKREKKSEEKMAERPFFLSLSFVELGKLGLPVVYSEPLAKDRLETVRKPPESVESRVQVPCTDK